MSSATMISPTKSLFETYLVNQDNGNETDGSEEKPTEKPSEQSATLAFEVYAPKRESFHSVGGKIKRFLA